MAKGIVGQSIQTNAEGNVIFKRGSKESLRTFSSFIPMSFRPNEFSCKCGICSDQIISMDLVNGLQKLRDIIQKPIHISSAYRCERHQERLKDQGYEVAKKSLHCQGKAADIYIVGMNGLELAKLAAPIFNGIGVSQTWIHVDVRPAPTATWIYGGLILEDIKKEIGRI